MELLDAPRQPFLQDETISEHYEVRRLLGEGGFGHVFEAWDAKLCRSVALKRLKPQADLQHPEKLIKEARLAASLRHSAFVRIFSIDGNGHGQSIVMELVEGQTLGQFMQGAPVALDTALDIASQIADAMDEAHAMDLVHGDLKPSNLMIEADGKVRILDFGLARQLDPQATQTTALGDLQGTIAYMAPERLMGRPPDMRGDIYALGTMLYEMLAGQRPFSHLNGLALAAAHMQPNAAWPALPDTVPPAIAALVRSMTAHEPVDRPSTMGVIREAIAAHRNGLILAPAVTPAPETTLPPVPPTAVSIRVPVPSKRSLQIGAGIMALMLLLTWQWSNITPAVTALVTGEKAPAPYSEVESMAAGMKALSTFDQAVFQNQASEYFSTILKRNPEHAGANAGISLVYTLRYLGSGRDQTWLQRADIAAKQALITDDQLAMTHVALAWVMEHQGQLTQAMQEVTISLNLEPNNFFALYAKARLFNRTQKIDLAKDVLNKSIKIYPNNRFFLSMLARINYNQGNYIEAERLFRTVMLLNPEIPDVYAHLSATLDRLNRSDEALQVLQKGLLINPDWELYTNLGNSLFNRGDYIGATQAFKNAVSDKKGSPNNYLLWANLADAQRWVPSEIENSHNSYLRAINLIKSSFPNIPDDAQIHSRFALYSAYVGLHEDALKHVKNSLNLAPNFPDINFRATLTYELLGKRNEAIAALENALKYGYPINFIETAPDLLNLRRDARYQKLILKMERK
ncbi:serine/threonine-protein kinase [Janthinobacterium aquaticum]|uniref:serine/threonine-protein kinase n=1 Tax=Janthinobacterium sp. FT58W TaxID=2654254 RepID=UPI0012652FD9|nr:serine/threonine-protein kinase [Janthinobacterium sp. FT58W]KAB8041828.1 protein kinase [Janthinobacterium sp. FT58W]